MGGQLSIAICHIYCYSAVMYRTGLRTDSKGAYLKFPKNLASCGHLYKIIFLKKIKNETTSYLEALGAQSVLSVVPPPPALLLPLLG